MLLAEFNNRSGTDFRIASRFASGLQGGAWLLVDGSGRRAVLKSGVTGVESLASMVEVARDGGYPTPRWLGFGATFYVQEYVEGVGATPLTSANTPLLLDVLELQADLLPDGDLVHGDFNSCNILLGADGVAGVIDVGGFRAGTRLYDYACLLREAYVEDYGDDVISLITTAALDAGDPAVLAACASEASEFILGFKQQHEPWRMDEVRSRLRRMHADLAIGPQRS
jgi:hypothetical protein